MWVRYTKSDRIWEINVPNLEFFMRSCAHAEAGLKNSTTNNEFVAFGPDLTTVDVDWPTARKDRDDGAAATLHKFYDCLDATQSGQILRELLVTMKARSDADDRAYLQRVCRAQQQTNIKSSVATGKVAESIAVFARDASATVLLLTGAAMTGGAILPLVEAIAAGTSLKFVGAADRVAFRLSPHRSSRTPQAVLVSGLTSTGAKMITEERRRAVEFRRHGRHCRTNSLHRGARSHARADGGRALHRKFHHKEGRGASSLTYNTVSVR